MREPKAVRSISEADRAWLSALYEANFAAVAAACGRVLGNQDDAADAAHEVFLRALDALQDRSDVRAARPWLLAVARNHCLDLLRRRKRFDRAVTTLAASAGASTDVDGTVADRQMIKAVITSLRARERTLLWHSAVERRPIAEIATFLGLSYMAAAQSLHRARKHALLLAAKLAAIFGVYRVGRSMRPGASVAAVAIAPMLLTALISSSVSHSDSAASAGGSHPAVVISMPKAPVSSNPQPALATSTGAVASPSTATGLTGPLPIAVPDAKGILSTIQRELTRTLPKPTPPPAPVLALPTPTPGVVPPVLPTPSGLPSTKTTIT